MRTVLLFLMAIPIVGLGQKTGIRPGLALPYYIPQAPVIQDTSVINASALNVYKLFDSRMNAAVRFGATLFNGVTICEQNGLRLRISQIQFTLKPDGIEIDQTPADTCSNPLAYTGFTTNREAIEQKNGEIQIVFIKEKKRYETVCGRLEIDRKQMRCDDTGSNPVLITLKGGSLYFKNVGNVLFFEADADNDKGKELYLLDYASCSELLKIYKITPKKAG